MGTELQQALHDIIDNHTSVSYATLWTSFKSTDKKSNGKIWDMYSDIPGGTPPYEYTFGIDQCGSQVLKVIVTTVNIHGLKAALGVR